MAKITEKFKKFALILVAVLLIPSTFGVSGGVYAAAETEGSDSAIMRDLGGLTVGGEKFNIEDYPADEEGTPQLLYLSEYGYGYTPDKQVAYGLALYIYNPAQLDIVQDVRNTVQMKIGNAERYSKYALNVIEDSADKLFYKLGVSFTDEEKNAALSALDKDSRRYEVSSVEFYVEGFNATDYPISRAFRYTGYAAGLGENGESTLTNTLSYTEAGGTETISLSVNHTSWRPEGTNGNSEYTQDTIHSVYFAVPKELDEQYEYLKSVQARWIRARTAPIFVTGDSEAYDALKKLQKANAEVASYKEATSGNLTTGADGGDMRPKAPEKFTFSFDGWDYVWAFGRVIDSYGALTVSGFGFNAKKWSFRYYVGYLPIVVDHEIESLYLTAHTGGEYASEFVLTSSELTELIQSETQNGYFFNDEKVAGKYPSYLFSSYDENFTTEVITVGEFDKKLNLHSEEVKRNFWQKTFGGYSTENQKDYKNIQAIQAITDSDVNGKATQELSDSLYISERDAEDFRTFYEDNKKDSTVYLMRFAVSEYEVEKTTIFHVNKYSGVWAYDMRSQDNGYFAQTDCYLDFDIIDFEYVKEGTSYIIPVSMSPIDIFPELTPPPKYYDFWKYALIIMAALIGFYIVYKIVGKEAKK